jgi:hypothetical protein
MRAQYLLPAFVLVFAAACMADRATDPLNVSSIGYAGAGGGGAVGPQQDAGVTIEGYLAGKDLLMGKPGDDDRAVVELVGPAMDGIAANDGDHITLHGKWADEGVFWVDACKILQ